MNQEQLDRKKSEIWAAWKFIFSTLNVAKWYGDWMMQNNYVQQGAKMHLRSLVKGLEHWERNLHSAAPRGLMAAQNESMEESAAHTVDFLLLAEMVPREIADKVKDRFKAIIMEEIDAHVQSQKVVK